MIPLLLALLLARIPPAVEIGAWAVATGTPMDLALAVAHVETGHIPESRRDRARGPGGVGRMQVHPRWGRVLHRDLWDRHQNIAVGVVLLACAVRDAGKDAAAHYNDGRRGTAKGLLYQKKVEIERRRLLPGRSS